MKKSLTIIGVALAFQVILGGFACHLPSTSSMTTEAQSPQRPSAPVPVVVELFTSEGCSSCPPADSLLEQLESSQPIANVEILPLAFHVDYWNELGWVDPFASRQFTERQRAYGETMGLRSIYTPQMVVDGKNEFVGGRRSDAFAAIVDASHLAKIRIDLSVPALKQNADLPVSIKLAAPTQIPAGRKFDLWLALTESKLHSNVLRGENGGRTLSHTGVVRKLWQVGQVSIDSSSPSAGFTQTISISPDWNPKNLRLVAFLQEINSGRIVGAGSYHW
ncbi:MAG: DUF1223 domain-containing protein [Blastocatellia bacterium]|nr:DUF1223 domain-containing protein [Blastocatellia bacterium]